MNHPLALYCCRNAEYNLFLYNKFKYNKYYRACISIYLIQDTGADVTDSYRDSITEKIMRISKHA